MLESINRNIIEYEVYILIMYLFVISLTERMTMVLPVYIVFALVPVINRIRIYGNYSVLYILYSFVYLFTGVVFQEKYPTLISFFSRIFQFIVFCIFVYYSSSPNRVINYKRLLFSICFAETILGVYLLSTSTMLGIGGLMRTVAGNQPVGGNLAISVLPFIIYAYFNNNKLKNIIFFNINYLLLWIIISGTRGYLLLFLLSMLPIYYDYIFKSNSKINSMIIKLSVIISVIIGSVFFIFSEVDVLDYILTVTRMNDSTGIRDLENKVALSYFFKTTLFNELFGMGLGGIAEDKEGFASVLFEVMGSQWAYSAYIGRIGLLFHNIYGNILVMQGLFGCCMLFLFFVWGMNTIFRYNHIKTYERVSYIMYWIGFFMMNYYRWSSECGISEMLFLGLLINLSRCDSAKKQYYKLDR